VPIIGHDEGEYPLWVFDWGATQPASLFPKILRTTGLWAGSFVVEAVIARCGDTPASPPRCQPKSIAAAPRAFWKHALIKFDLPEGCRQHFGVDSGTLSPVVPLNWKVAIPTLTLWIISQYCLCGRSSQQILPDPHASDDHRCQLGHAANGGVDLDAGKQFAHANIVRSRDEDVWRQLSLSTLPGDCRKQKIGEKVGDIVCFTKDGISPAGGGIGIDSAAAFPAISATEFMRRLAAAKTSFTSATRLHGVSSFQSGWVGVWPPPEKSSRCVPGRKNQIPLIWNPLAAGFRNF